MNWQYSGGTQDCLAAHGTFSNALGKTEVILFYHTDANRMSARNQGLMPGHDFFVIVPHDQANEEGISMESVIEDPLGVLRIFHRTDNFDLAEIKRTIEMEARLMGFVPD